MCFCVCRSVEYLQNACCEGTANKDFDSDSDSDSDSVDCCIGPMYTMHNWFTFNHTQRAHSPEPLSHVLLTLISSGTDYKHFIWRNLPIEEC